MKIFMKSWKLFVLLLLMVGSVLLLEHLSLNATYQPLLFAVQKSPEKELYHDLSLEEPYRSRIHHIWNMCSQKNLTKKFKLVNKKSFKYEDNSKLVMCEVPKVASTTWQILLLRFRGFQENFTEQLRKQWGYSTIPNKSFQSIEQESKIWEIMTTYTTFFLTRHPFERLVSAYYDKFSDRSRFEYYKKKFGKKIAEEQASEYLHGIDVNRLFKKPLEFNSIFSSMTTEDQKEVKNYLKAMRTGEISFHQFVKHIIKSWENGRVESMDIHWRPQVLLCHPCQFNYSYVIKFENVVPESNRLLEYVQTNNLVTPLPESLYFPEQNNPSTNSTILTQKTMLRISEESVEKLREIYKDDFIFFNYNPYLYKGFESVK